ncbi:MAG: substrate-binding domain-containing protein [Clostridia bacterium]|nr:substrate-binding domain-containing protein [Clostridia bacterium]
MKKLSKQIGLILLVIAVFALFNCSIYSLMTRRLSNNFSGATKAQMIDVGSYLPFEEESDLPHIETDFTLSGDLPVLDGAAALVPVYASVIDTVYPEGCVTYEGGSFSDDNYYGENFAPDSKMQYRNTVRGYKAVVDGGCDILFCASPSKEQTEYAEEKGVELVYVPVGLEGFVFFVNKNNPVEDLTTEEVRDIYAGEITNWKELGGPYRPINPVTRLEGSGSQSAMNAFMGEREIAKKSPLVIMGGSIGFSFRYYMDGIVENSDVKMLSLNGVYPSAENIQNGSYPIIAKFFAIYRADNDNENVSLLIDWILSDEGQTLIEKTGYVRIEE